MSNSHNFSAFSSLFKNITNFTTLLSSLIISVSVLSFNLPKVSVSAGNNVKYRIVTHPNGINIRDKNCQIIDQVGYGEILMEKPQNPVNLGCNIGGQKNMEMANYGTVFGNSGVNSDDMFVSTKYTRAVNSGTNGTYTTQDKVRLNNPAGVNLRDNNCQRVMTLPNGTYSENSMGLGGSVKICKAGGEFYTMTYFIYKGQVYNVAEVLTKYE